MREVEHRLGIGVVALALLLSPAIVAGQLSTQDPASILFFPLVAADGAEDTLIQVSNASNQQVHARCFYLVAAVGALQTTDFFITLTRQQPTHWVASSGRPADSTDPRCSPENSNCPGAGLDPGTSVGIFPLETAPVPPAPAGLRGALLCVQTDVTGFPFGGNGLLGRATIAGSDASVNFTYEAVASLANPDIFGGGGNVLQLNNTPTVDGQADGCPQAYFLNHLAEGAEDGLLESPSVVSTSIAAMPCSLDLANGQASSVTLDFQVTTDLEDTFSASTTVEGFLDANLTQIDSVFAVGTLGSAVARTRIGASPGGAVIVGRELRSSGSGLQGTTGVLLHRDKEQRIDAIVLPAL